MIIRFSELLVNRYSESPERDHLSMEQVPVFTSFGDRLAWWITHRKTTQSALAEKVGIKPSTMNELCRGKSQEPRAGAFLRMAIELGLRPEYLMWGEGQPEASDFSRLSGLESQLVMLYRALPDDTKRDAMLIDMNHAYNAGREQKPSRAMPFVKPPPSVTPTKKTTTAKKATGKRAAHQ